MEPQMKRKSFESFAQSSKGATSMRDKNQSRYIGDPRLVGRIEQYLSANRHLSKVNLKVMADHLQKQYSGYARKKTTPFRLSVEKAYKLIAKEYNVDQPDDQEDIETAFIKRRKKQTEVDGIISDSDSMESDDSKSFSSDVDKYKSYKDQNSMNNTLSNLYRKTASVPPNNESDTTGVYSPNQPASFFIDKRGNCTQAALNAHTGVPEPCNQESPSGLTTPSKPVKTKDKDDNKSLKKRVNKKTIAKDKEEKKPLIQKSSITFTNIGGNEKTLSEVCKLLVHMKHGEVYSKLGVTPPRGFLLHGPPGSGKSLLANAIAGELDLPLIKLAATEIVSGVSGESEEKLRDIFTQAAANAPCILFLDEIDAISQKRENASKDMERRIVSQLLTCMDDLSDETQSHVLVIGATNRPDSLDPALRRAGRFDREISLGIPDEDAREKILRVLCRNLRLVEGFDFVELAHQTPGYVGADLNSLAREAAMTAVNRILDHVKDTAVTKSSSSELDEQQYSGLQPSNESKDSVNFVMAWLRDKSPLTDQQLADIYITMDDFREALRYVQPSAKREGFATIPDVTWDDIGALADVREELELAILAPVRHREQFARLGLVNPPGILLAGPPGCGKTLLAKAIANESGINFISVKGPELLNMYVGESERAVRQVFQRARNSAPCVIFFDELDALCPKRSQSSDSGPGARVVNQLLTEMDGLEERKQVFIMAATNRPDIIDPAILRPGRLDKILYVGLPTPSDRTDILRTITKNGTKPVIRDVSLASIGYDENCLGYTGADLAALVREASVMALKAFIRSSEINGSSHDEICVTREHFDLAFGKVRPSVSSKDMLFYEAMRERLVAVNI